MSVLMIKFLLVFVAFAVVQSAKPLVPIPDLGSNKVVPGITVHGSVIVGDQTNDQRAAYSSVPAAVASQINHNHNDMIRNMNFQQLTNLLPMPLAKWPTVYARPCPHYSQAPKSSDKGNGLSHYQIWLEFIFFDHDLLEAVNRKPPEYLVSNAWSSNSGKFQSFANGSFHKNGVPFLEDDIIVIVEDSAYTAINSSAVMLETLRSELTKMTTDLVYLGWCDEPAAPVAAVNAVAHSHHAHAKKVARLTHSCMYAYAVTRRGARQLAKYYDVCGARSLEEQVSSFAKYGWLSTRQAKAESYSRLPKVDHPLGMLSSGGVSTTVDPTAGATGAAAATVEESSSSSSRVTNGIFLQVKEAPIKSIAAV